MLAASAILQRHPAEAELLARAVAGQRVAVDSVLSQLGSANKWLQQIMMETIQDSADRWSWQCLLGCLALHRWEASSDAQRREAREASRRLDETIVCLFVEDEAGTPSAPVKVAVLHEQGGCKVRRGAKPTP